MNCQDTRSLMGPYLDSELDVQASQEIRDHLVSCPECAALFAAEDSFQRRLRTALRRGERTPSLWEAAVERVGRAAPPEVCSASGGSGRWRVRAEGAWAGWLWWLWPSPQFYAVLAAVWLGLLAGHFATQESTERAGPGSPDGSGSMAASASVGTGLAEQRRWLDELLDGQEESPPRRSATAPPSRSAHPNPWRSA